jgi:hypothetical protein
MALLKFGLGELRSHVAIIVGGLNAAILHHRKISASERAWGACGYPVAMAGLERRACRGHQLGPGLRHVPVPPGRRAEIATTLQNDLAVDQFGDFDVSRCHGAAAQDAATMESEYNLV